MGLPLEYRDAAWKWRRAIREERNIEVVRRHASMLLDALEAHKKALRDCGGRLPDAPNPPAGRRREEA